MKVTPEEEPRCACCGATKNLWFFHKLGFILCNPCLAVCLRILELAKGGIGEEELEFRLRVLKSE